MSDGTPEGTVLLADLPGGPTGSMPKTLAIESSRVFFTADDGTHGRELWVSDGTREGTLLLGDLNPGPASSGPQQFELPDRTTFVRHAGRVFFTADDGTHGRELWATDGTPEGTVLLGDLRPGSDSSEVRVVGTWGNRVVFTEDDGTHGRELWATDGTPEGTVMLEISAQALTARIPQYVGTQGGRALCHRR